MVDPQQIIEAIDRYLEENNLDSTNPVDANHFLTEKGLLKDDTLSPGLPLRELLRGGQVPHAYQRNGKYSNWIIPHSYDDTLYKASFLNQDQFKEELQQLAKDEEIKILKAFFHFKDCKAYSSQISRVLSKEQIIDINRPIGNLGKRITHYYPEAHKIRDRYWPVLFQGRQEKDGFLWILRPELKEAMVKLSWDEIEYPGESIPPNQQTYREGGQKIVLVSRVERNSQARNKCLEVYGYRCRACGMAFGERYGELASGFIHVHHRYPLAQKDEPSAIDPVKDLVPLCPNCHAVAHMGKEKPFAVEELREMLSNHSHE